MGTSDSGCAHTEHGPLYVDSCPSQKAAIDPLRSFAKGRRPGHLSPSQAGYTNATALTTGLKEKLYSLLAGRVQIRLVS